MSILLLIILIAIMLAATTILIVLGSDFYSDLDRFSKEREEGQFYDWMSDTEIREQWVDEGEGSSSSPDQHFAEYSQWAGEEEDLAPCYQQRVREYEQWITEQEDRDRSRGLIYGAALVAAIAAAAGYALVRRR
jgi:hypothetical protein